MRWTIAWPVLLVGIAIAASGCTASRSNQVDSGMIALKRESSRRLSFPWIRVYQDDAAVVVRGSIRRSPFFNGHVSGVVGIHLLAQNGEQLAVTETRFRPGRIPITGPRRSYFHAQVARLAPEGSVVSVDYHGRPGRCPYR